jgi:hypothetical protein
LAGHTKSHFIFNSAANTHAAEAVLQISSDSSCIFSAASYASVLHFLSLTDAWL